jgi:hypothetical protein
MNPTIRNFLIGGVIGIAFIVLLAWPTKQTILAGRPSKYTANKPQTQVNQANKRFPCVSTMDPTYFKRFTELAQKYDQIAFDHLVIPRLRYHFDERFAPHAQSHDNSAMITLFVYPADEDWGQHELIDATLKVWFGSAAGNVATIDIAGVKSVDEIRQKIYEIILECDYTVIRFKNAEHSMTPEIFQVLQDVRHLSQPGRKELDGSKAIYFFEYGVAKNHIQREDFLKLMDQYRTVVKTDPWHKYFNTVGLVQNITDTIFNSTFNHMLGSRMRVSVIPFLPILPASIKAYLDDKSFSTFEANTEFAVRDQYLSLIGEKNPGIKVYKYIDDTDCNASPFSLPCLKAQCSKLTCNNVVKTIQIADKAVTCTC